MKKFIKTVILIGFLVMMYCLSAQNGNDSSALSNSVLNYIYDWVKSLGNYKLGLISNWINSFEGNSLYNTLSFYIRKLAHFSEFFILFILSYECFKEYKIKHVIVLSLAFCLLCAITDELHQFFVLGRVASLRDCLIDLSGSVFGYLFWHHLCKK